MEPGPRSRTRRPGRLTWCAGSCLGPALCRHSPQVACSRIRASLGGLSVPMCVCSAWQPPVLPVAPAEWETRARLQCLLPGPSEEALTSSKPLLETNPLSHWPASGARQAGRSLHLCCRNTRAARGRRGRSSLPTSPPSGVRLSVPSGEGPRPRVLPSRARRFPTPTTHIQSPVVPDGCHLATACACSGLQAPIPNAALLEN